MPMQTVAVPKYSPSIVHVGLHAHVVRSQVLNPALGVFNPDTFLVHAQSFIALADQPLIRLLYTSSVRRNDQAWPKSVLVAQVWELVLSDLEKSVNPVQVGLEVQVVPQAVTVDKGEWLRRLASAQSFAETQDFLVRDGVADDDLNWCCALAKQSRLRDKITYCQDPFDVGHKQDCPGRGEQRRWS